MSETQRWQVPILEDDSAELARLAKLVDHPQAIMAVRILEAALEGRANVVEWMAARLGVGVTRARDALKRKRRRPAEKQKSVRIELQLPSEVANEIHRMALGMGISDVRMASLLMTAGLDENSGIMEIAWRLIVGPIKKVRGNRARRDESNED